jgi:RNA polymerase sigma-70 factor (ECF subfamily)
VAARREVSDAELITAPDAEGEAFAMFYERHVDGVLRFFVRRTGCAQTAADLTSETFAAALVARRRYVDTGAPGRAWLFKIAQRQLNRFVRKAQVSERARRRAGIERIELSPEDIDRVERMVDLQPVAEALRDAVGSLPVGQAEALRLRVGEGLSYRDVAAVLGCSEGAARVRVSRGLSALADLMGAS